MDAAGSGKTGQSNSKSFVSDIPKHKKTTSTAVVLKNRIFHVT